MLKRVHSMPWRACIQPHVGGQRSLWAVINWRTLLDFSLQTATLHSLDRDNTLGWRHATTAREETYERALALVHGESWRDCLVTPSGREAWRKARREYPWQWLVKSGKLSEEEREKKRCNFCRPTMPLWCLPYHKLEYRSRTFRLFLDSAIVA